jgi:hypothetical protein
MGVASGEKAISDWSSWILLDREKQPQQGLIEAPKEENTRPLY